MTKKELREKYKLLRLDLDQKTIDKLSQECFSVLFTNFDLKAKNIGIFLPIKSKQEPNTFLLLSEFSTDTINYFAPKIDQYSDTMAFYSISSEKQIEFGPYEIPEPSTTQKTALSNLDIILLPLLCFDIQGNRVGYGKGYYDKLLENAPEKTLKIGISLFSEPEKIDDVNSTDIKMDFCITPNKLLRFRNEK
ncbi:MAG: 5-formyltetrahydrofolate cyclo-ligase [Bacteroidota bacterium]